MVQPTSAIRTSAPTGSTTRARLRRTVPAEPMRAGTPARMGPAAGPTTPAMAPQPGTVGPPGATTTVPATPAELPQARLTTGTSGSRAGGSPRFESDVHRVACERRGRPSGRPAARILAAIEQSAAQQTAGFI